MLPITTYLRIARIVGVIALVVGLAWYGHHKFEVWRQALYNSGYTSGVSETNLKWQTASAQDSRNQLNAAISDMTVSRAAVSDYLNQLQKLTPQLTALNNQRITYVQSPAGAAPCLDTGGMSLIRAHRKALGLDAGPDPKSTPARGATP